MASSSIYINETDKENESDKDNNSDLEEEPEEEEETIIGKSKKKRSIVHDKFNYNEQDGLHHCIHCR
jgi:hypothetical protein